MAEDESSQERRQVMSLCVLVWDEKQEYGISGDIFIEETIGDLRSTLIQLVTHCGVYPIDPPISSVDDLNPEVSLTNHSGGQGRKIVRVTKKAKKTHFSFV